MIGISSSGSFDNTDSFLQKMISGNLYSGIDSIAEQGVSMLQAATPQESGVTASSWSYEIVEEHGAKTIWFVNHNVINGFNIAIGLQYGHGTGTGGYVAGVDYINPALKPIFDKIADAVWKEVQRS